MALKDIKSRKNNFRALSYTECQAKSSPPKTVIEHSIEAANVANQLSILYSSYESITRWGTILSAVHDSGKISPGFQKKYFSDFLREKLPELANANETFEDTHAVISDAAVREYLNEFLDDSAAGIIAGIHHGTYKEPKPNDNSTYGGKDWAQERIKFIKAMTGKFGPLPTKYELSPVQQAVLAGFVCISDWIASNEKLSCKDETSAKNTIEHCGFLKPEIKKGLSFYDVFDVFKNNPYPVQKAFIDSVKGPGVYILESSTGSGKTEAALYAAYKLMVEKHNNGIYFALPTQLTSDRIHKRVQDFVDSICERHVPVMLAHGSAWLNDEVMKMILSGGEEMSPGGSWFTPRKRTLLAPFGVGTIDQALMSVMNVKHYFVRSFGLFGKVVILDEVHSYDVYTGMLLDKLVETLRKMGCSVIILSATLTKDRKEPFFTSNIPSENHYPLVSIEREGRISIVKPESKDMDKKISLSFDLSGKIDDIVKIAVQKASSGQCVLWITNTVGASQCVYNKIAGTGTSKEKPLDLGLLHSRFTVLHRREKEDQWMNKLGKDSSSRPKGCILVATQVVEQSVDIDADFMISELAPMDMLIQRLGRLWRHERKDRAGMPELLITTGDLINAKDKDAFISALGKNNSMVYAPYILWKTWITLKEKKHLDLPSQTRDLLESVYAISKNEPDFVCELRKGMEAKAQKLQEMAGGALADVLLPAADDDETAQTRYSEIKNIDCLLLKEIKSTGNSAQLTLLSGEKLEVSDLQKDPYATRLLHKNIVQAPQYHFRGHKTKIPEYLKKHFFGQLAVLTVGEDGNLAFDGEATKLFYNKTIGLHKKQDYADKIEYKMGEYDYELDNGWLDSGSY